MPELIIERPKMSLQMHETLKRYILRERRKKKEEDVANEQKMREELKKAEMKTQTLENNKEQLKQLEVKLDDLTQKKRDLFNQLKKVLNEETNLKKSSRPSLPPQGSLMPGDQSNPLSMLMYSAHPGHPQILAPQQHHPPPQLITQPPGLSNLPQPTSILPIGSLPSNPSSSQSNVPSSQSNQLINKPQSPFHPPPHLLQPHHLSSHTSSNFLKYFNANALSPQMLQTQGSLLMPPSSLNPNLLNPVISSPSSSPHLLTSSPRHQLPPGPINQPSQNTIKRQRSPSPPPSSPHLTHNQYLFNQNQLLHQPSISPANLIPSSPPPLNSLSQSNPFNSPSSTKKVRPSSNSNVSQSPQHQLPRPNSQSASQQQQQQQQQSAFSSYINRAGITGFQSPSSQNKNSNQQPPNQIPAPQFSNQHPVLMPSQTPPGVGANFNMPRNIPQSALSVPPGGSHPGMPPVGHLGVNLPHHYLNSISQDQAKMLFQQQQQQPFMHQPHFANLSSIPIMSAAAVAAVAAAAANAHQHPSQSGPISGNGGANSGSGGGSILTGFSIRSNNSSSNQQF